MPYKLHRNTKCTTIRKDLKNKGHVCATSFADKNKKVKIFQKARNSLKRFSTL